MKFTQNTHPTRLIGTWEYVLPVKIFVAFSEYMNFTSSCIVWLLLIYNLTKTLA